MKKQLLRQPRNPNEAKNDGLKSPCETRCGATCSTYGSGHLDAVGFLVEVGAKDQATNTGASPLLLAAVSSGKCAAKDQADNWCNFWLIFLVGSFWVSLLMLYNGQTLKLNLDFTTLNVVYYTESHANLYVCGGKIQRPHPPILPSVIGNIGKQKTLWDGWFQVNYSDLPKDIVLEPYKVVPHS